jgi:hypothetical protein
MPLSPALQEKQKLSSVSTTRKKEKLPPPIGLQPLPRWALRSLSAPWRSGTPHTSSKSRQSAGRASTPCHVSCSFGPHLPVEVGSGTATFPAAPAPMLSHGPRASPPCWVELRRCHVFLSSGPRLPAEVGSGAATCPMAPDSASLRGELWRCHVFLSSGPRLPAEVGSGATTMPRPCLPERRAPVLPRRLQGVRICHYSSVQQCNAGPADHSCVRNRTLTLIEREDDTRSWRNFLVFFSHSTTMSCPPRGWEYILIGC